MKRLIEVEVFGQTFTVNSEDDEEYVRQLASYVDQRMRQVGGSSKTAVPLRVAIMAAMITAAEVKTMNANRRRSGWKRPFMII